MKPKQNKSHNHRIKADEMTQVRSEEVFTKPSRHAVAAYA
jgi:hypothetical protein